MNDLEKLQTIIRYMAKHAKNLENCMPGEKHYIASGASTSDIGGNKPYAVYGTLVDVIADAIEKKEFFGWYISAAVSQADNPNNAKFIRITPGFEGALPKGQVTGFYGPAVLIELETVKEAPYAKVLQTKKGFVNTAQVLIPNAKEIADMIYSR